MPRARPSRLAFGLLVTSLAVSACGTRLDDSAFESPVAFSEVAPADSVPGHDPAGVTPETAPGGPAEAGSAAAGGAGRDRAAAAGATASGGGARDAGGGPASTRPANRATDVGVQGDEIVVGNITSASGPVPGQFTPMVEGARAYFARLNAQGGVNGRRVRLVSCDDRSDRNRNRACVQQLLDEQRVFALVANASMAYSGAADVARRGVPDVGGQPVGSEYYRYPTLYAIRGGQYERDGDLGHGGKVYAGTAPFRHLKQQLGLQHAAVFNYAVAQSQAYARFLVEALRAEGYRVTQYEVSPALPSFDSYVADMQANGVDAIFDAMDLTGNQNLCRSMERNGVSVRAKVSGVAAWSQRVGSQFPEICTRSMYAFGETLPYTSQHPEVDTFRRTMSQVYGGRLDGALHIWHLEGWNAARLFTEGVRSLGANVTRAGLIAWLDSFTQDRGWDGGGVAVPQSWQPVDYGGSTRECVSIAAWSESAGDFVIGRHGFPVCHQVPWIGYVPADG